MEKQQSPAIGNYVQYPATNHNGKDMKTNIHVCVCVCVCIYIYDTIYLSKTKYLSFIYIYIYIAESPCCTEEIDTTLQINYIKVKLKKKTYDQSDHILPVAKAGPVPLSPEIIQPFQNVWQF